MKKIIQCLIFHFPPQGSTLENGVNEKITEPGQPKKGSNKILITISIVIVAVIVLLYVFTVQSNETRDSDG